MPGAGRQVSITRLVHLKPDALAKVGLYLAREDMRIAPTMKDDFYTVLSSRDCLPEVRALLEEDPRLRRCFVD